MKKIVCGIAILTTAISAAQEHPISTSNTELCNLLEEHKRHIDSSIEKIFEKIAPKSMPSVYIFLGDTGEGKSTLINILAGQPLIANGRDLKRPENERVDNFFEHVIPGSGQTSETKQCHLALHEGVVYVDSPGFGDIPRRDVASEERTVNSLGKYYSTSYLFERLNEKKLHPKIVFCLTGQESSFNRTGHGSLVNRLFENLKRLGTTIPHQSICVAWTRSTRDFGNYLNEEVDQYYNEVYQNEQNIVNLKHFVNFLKNGCVFLSTKRGEENVQSFFHDVVKHFHEKMNTLQGWSNPQFRVGEILDDHEKASVVNLISQNSKNVLNILKNLSAPVRENDSDLDTAVVHDLIFQKFTDNIFKDLKNIIALIEDEKLLNPSALLKIKSLAAAVMALKTFSGNPDDSINREIRDMVTAMKDRIKTIQNQKKVAYNHTYEISPSHCKARARILRRGFMIPDKAIGKEDLYEKFLKIRLVYQPNLKSDDGKIEIPFLSLTSILSGTFDLSLCGDAGKYISIHTGYPQNSKISKDDKVRLWISPRFLFMKELGQDEYYQRMMQEWDEKILTGLFFTHGSWPDDHAFHANISGTGKDQSNMRDVFTYSKTYNKKKYDNSILPGKIAYAFSGGDSDPFPSRCSFPPHDKEYKGRDVKVGVRYEWQDVTCHRDDCAIISASYDSKKGFSMKTEAAPPFHTHPKKVEVPVYEWKEYDTEEEKQAVYDVLLSMRGAYHYMQHFSLMNCPEVFN